MMRIVSEAISSETFPIDPLQSKGARDEQIARIGSLKGNDKGHQILFGLRKEIKKFLRQVDGTEQPFGRIHELLQDAGLHSKDDTPQLRNRILTTVLLIHSDYAILLRFLNSRQKESADFWIIKVALSSNRKECEALVSESYSRSQPGNVVEGKLY